MRNNRRKRRQLQKEHREKRHGKEGNPGWPAARAGSAGAIKNRVKSKVRRETLRLLSPADGIDRERSPR